ncbi:MAG: hypothetical protein QM765_49365 [Myxococcales bacterium]
MTNRTRGRARQVAQGLLALLSFIGCTRHFTRVDFKYTSDSHLRPGERFIAVPASPEAVGALLRSFVTEEQGQVSETLDRLPFHYRPSPEGEEVWGLTRAIVEREWEAFHRDSPALYDRIERRDPRLQAPELVKVDDPAATTSFLKASVAPRGVPQERKVRTRDGYGPFGDRHPFRWTTIARWTVNEALDSVLLVWWWPRGDGSTVVYARALPRMVKQGLEASPGARVQYGLWSSASTDGAIEAEVVRRLFSFLRWRPAPATPAAFAPCEMAGPSASSGG